MKHILLLLFVTCTLAQAQKLPAIAEKTAGMSRQSGYLDFYWEEGAGKIWLEISKLDTEMLYQTSLPAGLGSNDIGLDRGLLGNTCIVKFTRVGRKVLLVQSNYGFRASSSSAAEKIAVEQSFAQSVLWGFTVEAETEGRVLVDATDFLLRDAMGVVNRIRNMHQGNYSLDRSRCAPYLPRCKSFPKNTELESTITLVDHEGNAGAFIQSVTPSPEAITLRMHHSLVELPDRDYVPRVFDPRSGYGSIAYFDYSSPVSESVQKYFAIRHRLRKKDPEAALSEAVKPIVYYLDNGTPEPIRSALLDGSRWWNQAFESAGYRDAFQVRLLPDSADPMDIRYNMINWVHRSSRGWSYGYSVVDPRTGEIIKGNVTLGSLRVRQDYLIAQGLLAPYSGPHQDNDPMLTLALARLRQLAAHEVGHTLGLVHNYAASASDRASVMDYPHPLVRLDNSGNISLSRAYAQGPGDWDRVAIRWGYQDFPPGTDLPDALNHILREAQKQGLQFISDRDARDPGGLHPQAHLWDNGQDPVKELDTVMAVRQKALAGFGENNIPPGVPMATLEDVLVPVYLFHRYQLEAVTKLVGGMYYSYAVKGDGQVVTRALSHAEQFRALEAAVDCMAPKNLLIPESVCKLIPPRPEGYDYGRELFPRRTGLAFDPLAAAETAADLPLSFLFNPGRLDRMVQYRIRSGGLGVEEMLDFLIQKTWTAPRLQGFEQLIQLQNEQLVLGYLLSGSLDTHASYAVRGSLLEALRKIKEIAVARLKTPIDASYRGHLLLALERIKSPDKAKPATDHAALPPGSPIGSDEEE
jgi:hypothetical protein